MAGKNTAPAGRGRGGRLSKSAARKRRTGILGGIYCFLIYGLLFLPIVIVVINSFNATTVKPYLSWRGFTLDWYAKLFENDSLLESFGNTMELAIVTTVVATVLGTIAAVGLYRYRFPGKKVVDGALYIPVVIPEIVMGISMLVLFTTVHVPQGMLTLVLAHSTFCLPFVIFNVRARLDGYDASLEEASYDLGAGKLRTFMNVTLPMLAPGIAGGALLSFTLSIDDVVVSFFVNGQTMTFPLMVWQSIKSGVSPDVNALSTLILVGTIALVAITQTGLMASIRERLHARRIKREAAARAGSARAGSAGAR